MIFGFISIAATLFILIAAFVPAAVKMPSTWIVSKFIRILVATWNWKLSSPR
jgi:hypothetical protein